MDMTELDKATKRIIELIAYGIKLKAVIEQINAITQDPWNVDDQIRKEHMILIHKLCLTTL